MFQNLSATTAVLIAFMTLSFTASAEMGRCVPDGQGYLLCGNGAGAARAIAKTISPSQRLAFAWRLTNAPPTNRPEKNDPDLENLIVRIEDGAVLAKSHGSYWDLGQKIAKQYMFAVWSPDSRLLIKVAQSAEFASAELFSFAKDDAATGPFELVEVVEPVVRAKMPSVKDPNVRDADNYGFVFSSKPAMTIDNNGLIRATISITGGSVYDLTVQATSTANFFDAKVVSITEHAGTSISIIVH
jgi:hypothetical protein